MEFEVQHGLHLPKLKNFEICTLDIKSEVLKKNPLKDSNLRSHPILIPKKKPKSKNGFPVVMILAGFTGNGPNYFGMRSFEPNFPQLIDGRFQENKAPQAVYVFVDAFTKVGGSQFVDSAAIGNYESHILKEVVPAILSDEDVSSVPGDWTIMGGSSGGYGALHLASKYPNVFSRVGAIAPDSFFQACYLADLYKSAETLKKVGGYKGVLKLIKDGELIKQRGWHDLINAVGMSACYSPKASGLDVDFPIDLETGELKRSVWKKWEERDPVNFLKTRSAKVKKLKGVFLEVGVRDEFSLQFGARQIKNILKKMKVKTHYYEFSGGHRDLSSRRVHFLEWLNSQ